MRQWRCTETFSSLFQSLGFLFRASGGIFLHSAALSTWTVLGNSIQRAFSYTKDVCWSDFSTQMRSNLKMCRTSIQQIPYLLHFKQCNFKMLVYLTCKYRLVTCTFAKFFVEFAPDRFAYVERVQLLTDDGSQILPRFKYYFSTTTAMYHRDPTTTPTPRSRRPSHRLPLLYKCDLLLARS